MLTREEYLDIRQSLIKELFTPFIAEDRKAVIEETLEAIAIIIEEGK